VRPAARIGLVLLYSLILQEVALRLVFPVPEVLGFDRSDYSPGLVNTSSAQHRSLANARFRWSSEPDGVESTVELNLYGFRDRDWPVRPRASGPRIAILGDSMVEGFMADAGETIPATFRKLLMDGEGAGDVLNLGVGAAGLEEYFLLARDAVPLFRPNHAILVLYQNDFSPTVFDPRWLEGALEPERPRPWLPRLHHVVSQLTEGVPVATRWGGRPFAFVGAVPDPRNPWSDEAKASRMAEYVRTDIAVAMSSGRFNPHVVNRFNGTKRRLERAVDLTPHLSALENYLGGYSCDLWVAYLPSSLQVSDAYLAAAAEISKPPIHSLLAADYQRHALELGETCRALGIPCLDLTPTLRQAESRGERLYWEYDGHMRPRGYATVGRAIFDWWKARAKT
jgi:hypothetical protein